MFDLPSTRLSLSSLFIKKRKKGCTALLVSSLSFPPTEDSNSDTRGHVSIRFLKESRKLNHLQHISCQLLVTKRSTLKFFTMACLSSVIYGRY